MKLRNKHVSKFVDSSTFARYLVSDVEGLLQVAVDLEYARLNQIGVPLVSQIKSRILDNVKRDFVILTSKIRAKNIPEKITDLFDIIRKQKVESYIKNIKLSEFDPFLLIHNAEKLGFSHRSKFKEFTPLQFQLKQDDFDKLHNNQLMPFTKKIRGTQLQRKRIHAHLFEKGQDWHCFYFDYKDVEERENRFKQGAHIHYFSHLWSHDKEESWNCFDTRFTTVDATHIKFEPFNLWELGNFDEDLTREIQKKTYVTCNKHKPSSKS